MARRTFGVLAFDVFVIVVFMSSHAKAQNSSSPVIPNLLVEISQDFANAAGSQVINKSDPFRTTKDKMRLIGMQQTNATVNIRFIPSSQAGMIELVMVGGTHAETDVYRRKVRLNMTTDVSYWGIKRLFIDECGIRDCPADTHPRLDLNQLNCLSTSYRYPIDPLVRKIAYRVYTKQKPKIDQGVLDDAQKELMKQFDGSVAERLVSTNSKYLGEIRGPMERRGIFPQRVRVLTSEHQLGIRLLLNDPTGKAMNFSAVPDIQGWPDVAVRLEESMLNNATHTLFAGKTFTGEELDKEFNSLLKPLMGEIKTREKDDEQFSITFPKEKPWEFHFDKQTFKVTLRGKEFTASGRDYDGMDTTAIYKVVKTPTGFNMERQGDLQIFPPGFKQGVDKVGAREQVLRKLLEKKFGQVFKPKFEIEEIQLPEAIEKAGVLVTTQVEADKGWLVLAWRRQPASQPPSEKRKPRTP
jgi:hypothetical protein